MQAAGNAFVTYSHSAFSLVSLLLQIKLLVEEGKADVLMTDRWGSTACDEVLKLNASRCIAYLEPITQAARERQRLEVEREAALDAET